MKYLIVSDIHGSRDSSIRIKEAYEKFNCDKILCLGDVLYHGPRNDLPLSYEPKGVIPILNDLKDNIICIWGNCEAEVDQMVLAFKISHSLDLNLNNTTVHIEHGHHLDDYIDNVENKAHIVLYGHTHIPKIEKDNNTVYINPGSITIPKNGSERGFAIWDNNKITLYTINGDIVDSYEY